MPARAFVGVLLDHFERGWDGTLLVLDEHEQFVAAIRFRDGLASSARFRDAVTSLQAGMLPLCGHVTGALMPVPGTDLVGVGPEMVSGVVAPQALIVMASREVVTGDEVERVIETIGTDWLRINSSVNLADWCFDETEQRVVECLSRTPCDLQQLAVRTELGAQVLLRVVYALWITRAVTPVPAWRPMMSGITEKQSVVRDSFDSEPTKVVQFDRALERVMPTSERPTQRTRALSARPSSRAAIQPTAAKLDSADTHLIVAEMLLERGDAKGAVLQAQKALRLGRLRPNQEALYAWLLYQREGGGAYVPTCTWQHLADALERDPNCERAHYYQGLLLKRRGDLTLAKKHLARALELNPDNADAQCELILLECGSRRPSSRSIPSGKPR